jgi:hypothetical protein
MLQPEAMLHRMDPRHVVVEVKRGGEDVAAQEARPPPKFKKTNRKRTVDTGGMMTEGVPHRRHALRLKTTDLHHSFKQVTSHVGPGCVPATLTEGHHFALSHLEKITRAGEKIKIAATTIATNLRIKEKRINKIKASHGLMYPNQRDERSCKSNSCSGKKEKFIR